MQEDNIEKESRLYDHSTMVATVIEAQNVGFGLSSVTLSVHSQAMSTPTAQGAFPQFNVQFRFAGAHINDALAVVLHDAQNELDTMSGTLPVRELVDQKIHDLWVPLRSAQREAADVRVHIQVQYVFSKAKICEEAIGNWRLLIEDYERQSEKFRRDLDQMYRPFDFLATITAKPAYLSDVRPVDRLAAEVR